MSRALRWALVCLLWACAPAAFSAAADPAAAAPAPDRANDLNNRGVAAAQAGQFEAGAAALRQALRANPSDQLVRRNLSGILTDWARQLDREGRTDQAEPLLREAVEHDPSNTSALVFLGDLAYFHRSDFTQAVGYWKQAYGQLPSAERRTIADRIAQAQRDQVIERQFAAYRTTHFDIRTAGRSQEALIPLGQVLETVYRAMYEALGSGPSRLTVIVYPEQDLHRTYNQRDWALGFYDGRLRVSGGELALESLRVLVAHELAHAFLHHLYGHMIPTWVHEGFAQVQEGERARYPEELQLEQGIRSGALWIPLKWLDRRFSQPSGREDVGRAYVEARLVIEELVARHGMSRFKSFLAALAKGTPVETAYDQAFTPNRWARTDQSILK